MNVEDARYELGREAAQRGEPLHDDASEEYKRGYSSGSGLFGGNTMPRRFGRGRFTPSREPWKCVCGEENRHYLVQCGMCGTRRIYGEDRDAKQGTSSGTGSTGRDSD